MTHPTPAEIEEAVRRAYEYVAHYDDAAVTNTSENMANARALLAVVAERDEALDQKLSRRYGEEWRIRLECSTEERTAEQIAAWLVASHIGVEQTHLDDITDDLRDGIRSGAWKENSDADE